MLLPLHCGAARTARTAGIYHGGEKWRPRMRVLASTIDVARPDCSYVGYDFS